MGRAHRQDPEYGWHHIMNRGAGKRDIFRHAGNAREFLDLVGQSRFIYGVEVHAYCLMPNHFHLLVHCPIGGVSDFMHRIGSMYTRSVNEQMMSDGPILRGRFRSLICDTPTYVDNVGRYIHRNPIEFRPDSSLAAWRWSSYPAYIGVAPRPNWLTTSTLLEWHGGRERFRQFVEDHVGERGVTTLAIWQWAIATAVAEFDLATSSLLSRNIERAVILGITGHVPPEIGERLIDTLAFPTRTARNSAMNRVRRRLEAGDSEFQTLIERAVRLAADARVQCHAAVG